MKKLFHFSGAGHPGNVARRANWLTAQRNFFLVPRQSEALQGARPAGLFGVLVSPYR
jgi:hypothetical protein